MVIVALTRGETLLALVETSLLKAIILQRLTSGGQTYEMLTDGIEASHEAKCAAVAELMRQHRMYDYSAPDGDDQAITHYHRAQGQQWRMATADERANFMR